jgi:hypothetical protein
VPGASLTRCRLRFGILPALVGNAGSRGRGQPLARMRVGGDQREAGSIFFFPIHGTSGSGITIEPSAHW